jgi:hypothetical protein
MKYERLFFICLFISILACNNDDVKPTSEEPKPLFSLAVPVGFMVENDAEKWVWVNDKNNEIIFVAQVSGDSTYNIELPQEYKAGDTYSLTVLHSYKQTESIYLETFSKLEPGQFALPEYISQSGIGNFSLTVQNAPGIDLVVPGKDVGLGVSYVYATGSVTISVPLRKSPGSFFCLYQADKNESPKYKKVGNATVGGSATVDFSEFVPMEIQKDITLEGAQYSTYDIMAVETENNEIERSYYLLGYGPDNERPSPISLYFSSNIAEKAKTHISYVKDKRKYGYYVLGGEPPSSFKHISATIEEVTLEGNMITAVTTGTYSFASLSARAIMSGSSASWSIYCSPEPTVAARLPKIPQELRNKHALLRETFIFPSVFLVKYAPDLPYNDILRNIMLLRTFLPAQVDEAMTISPAF